MRWHPNLERYARIWPCLRIKVLHIRKLHGTCLTVHAGNCRQDFAVFRSLSLFLVTSCWEVRESEKRSLSTILAAFGEITDLML